LFFVQLLLPLLLAQADTALPEERVRVDYVLVEVVARDSRDRLITDLTLEDFILRDGGKKIALESLDILDLRGGETALPATVRVAANLPRLRGSQVILAVDFEFADWRGVNETFRQMEDYLETTKEHADLSYLLYSLEGGALTDGFVTDPAVAVEALRDYRGRYEERRRGLRRDDAIADIRELETRFSLCAPGPGYAECIRDTLRIFLDFQNARTQTVMLELEALVDRFPENEQRHSIVFLSPGFSLHPGSAGVQLARLGYSEGTSLSSRVSGGLPGTLSFEKQMEELVRVCSRNRVVFHGFDIFNEDTALNRKMDASHSRGPSGATLSSYDSYQREMQRGMEDLARDTGGVFQVYLHKMRPVMEGDRFVYVLGYTRPAAADGSFRKIKVKCKRSGVRLRHRRGYSG
jgi:VWFA-related protein